MSSTLPKALFLGHVPPPQHGAAIVGQRVLSILSNMYDCTFFKINNSRSISNIGKSNIFQTFFFLLSLFFKVLFTLFFKRPKLVYLTPSLNGLAFLRDLPLLLLCYMFTLITDARVVCHIHMRPLLLLKIPFLLKVWNYLSRRFEVILLSKSLQADFSDNFSPKELHFLSNTSKVNIIAGAETGVANSVLYVGHIMKSKGAFRLLELIDRFQNSNITFHFAGEFAGNDVRNEFFNIVDNYSEGLIKYHGSVLGEEKEYLFNSADLLVLPSYSEAQPLTIIEAFSCGLPVIATPVGGIVDMLDETTGRCVPFEDFHNSILDVLDLGKKHFYFNCINKYNETFNEETFHKHCLKIFKGDTNVK